MGGKLTLKMLIKNIRSKKVEKFTLFYVRISENISGFNNKVSVEQFFVNRLVFLSASINLSYDLNSWMRVRLF